MAEKSALQKYRDKRNFDATPEPAAGGEANEDARSFVVQKHWASRLHYDFRLELEGTMKSWAVPKGPSFDPNDKRMAMPTEDHPIAYKRFEGQIPAGNYGAGKVIIWDKGTWHPLEDPHKGFRDGKLKFELRGHKLHGHWTLVRMKGRGNGREDPWLLIKERDPFAQPATEFSVVDEMPDSVKELEDRPAAASAPGASADAASGSAPSAASSGPPEGARPAKLPKELQPQLAVLVDEPPAQPQQWLFEIKFDGYRMLARVEGGAIALVTRNGNDWTSRLPGLLKALRSMDLPDGWYDGEIIMPAEDVPADFQALQGAFDSARTDQIVYYLFDLPFCAGQDLRDVPLEERRAVLQRIVERKPHANVRFSAEFDAKPEEMLESACRLGLEGVIAKRRGSAYVGRRSSDWIKLKCKLRQEFVIGGFTDPKGARTGVGSLLLGVHDEGGALRYAGNVGTGFNERTLADLRRRLDAIARERSPFETGTGLPRGAHWVQPELVCEVSFGEWTRDGKIRHSVFHGLRSDKPADAIGQEPVLHAPPPDQPATKAGKPAKKKAVEKAGAAAEPAAHAASTLPPTLRISNPDRVIDPQSGIRKIDLVRYYALVTPLMMPHLKDRPIAMVRAPDGVEGQLFFQKHLDRYKMAGVEPLDPAIFPGHPPMVYIAKPEGILSAAQMNVIEIHTWNGVRTAIDKPDRMTFDIDPGEGVGWPQIQEAAQLVRTLLDELQLPCFLKTSGGKGLHLVVPLKKSLDWDTVKSFSQAVVQHLARTLPDRFVAKSGANNRVGRIFIDYLRNGYGATTACAWSARSRPGLGISVPVRWDELPALKGGAHWTVATAHQRLDQGNAPWADYEDSRATLQAAMKKLGFTP
ncbi:DNA ligase D [Ramlibacter alkalitolerans]|uniref:DNA ligase (ATP) n=1 Tax=Ramlibacter alkalitolerans TaxID=2039631 RepID=A0ABS1JIA3_9BURK|nr:DNA ligase D [Ramlibacter alkalitolerans]MBL0423950.1 DNA ligase D [Ramlibacter alkalitolerans]